MTISVLDYVRQERFERMESVKMEMKPKEYLSKSS
jgi:hypothetical protein